MSTILTHQNRLLIQKRAYIINNLKPVAHDSESILQEAAEVQEGRIRFQGNHQVKSRATLIDIGKGQVDWTGKHIAHQEWPNQLNRFYLLRPLNVAQKIAPSESYAISARRYIEDWIDQVDAQDLGMRGNSCMDIALRLGMRPHEGWTNAFASFCDCESWDEEFQWKVICSIEEQAHILWKRAIPHRGRNNQMIFGLNGLLRTCLILPFLENTEKMIEFCRAHLWSQFQFQFLKDGAHFEQTSGYHETMTDAYISLFQLGKIFPEVHVPLPVDHLVRILAYGMQNRLTGFNDAPAQCIDPTDGIFDSYREIYETITGKDASQWEVDRDMIFPDAGHVFLRSGWEGGDDFLGFDSGLYSGAHAHLSRLSFVFRSGGRLWMADGGTFDYEMSSPYSIYGRSTKAHSTLNISGLNQGMGHARLIHHSIDDEIALLHGSYNGGYWPGEYTWGFAEGLGQGTHGKHERILLWIRGEYLLILDAMLSEPGLPVETVWQMAPVDGWEMNREHLSWQTKGMEDGFFLQMVLPPEKVEMKVYEGQKDPLRGWFCERQASGFSPAPQVVFSYPSDSLFYATLAMPIHAKQKPPHAHWETNGTSRSLFLEWPNGTTDQVVVAKTLFHLIDPAAGIESNSSLVWLRRDSQNRIVRTQELNESTIQ